jgi:hypothetical protein
VEVDYARVNVACLRIHDGGAGVHARANFQNQPNTSAMHHKRMGEDARASIVSLYTTRFRNSRRRIFPEGVLGTVSTKWTSRGCL